MVWAALASAVGSACKTESLDHESVGASLSPERGAVSQRAELRIVDHAPDYVNTLESAAVLMDFDTSDPALGHRLVAPKAWSILQKDLEERPKPFEASTVSIVARSNEPSSPRVTVAVRDVPFEVPVDGLTRHALTGEGWAIERARWLPSPQGAYFDVVALRSIDGTPWVRRTTARAAGGRIFEVNALAQRSAWDAEQDALWASGASFELHHGAGRTRFETWHRYAGGRPALELAYPESWQAEAVSSAPAQVSAVDLRAVDAAGKALLGYVQVRAATADAGQPASPNERVAAVVQKLEKENVRVDGAVRRLSDDDDPRSIAVKGWQGTFAAAMKMPDGSAAELRIGLLDRPGLDVRILGLGPSRADDPIASLRVQRAFEIARETLKVAAK